MKWCNLYMGGYKENNYTILYFSRILNILSGNKNDTILYFCTILYFSRILNILTGNKNDTILYFCRILNILTGNFRYKNMKMCHDIFLIIFLINLDTFLYF